MNEFKNKAIIILTWIPRISKTTSLITFGVCFFLTTIGYAQTDGNYEYSKEFIWGINKNTNGGLIGGFVMKWSKALDERTFRSIGFELMNVKHPKEQRISGVQGQFIFGKSNYLYTFRAQYGRDKILFKKSAQKGVQINAVYAAGPTLGIIAPYYVRNGDGEASQFNYEDFPSQGSIIGTGNLFQGLNESDITVGLNAKAALVFEMGAFKSSVTGFEIGTMVEAFPQVIELMPSNPANPDSEISNRAVFISGYLTLFYGRRK